MKKWMILLLIINSSVYAKCLRPQNNTLNEIISKYKNSVFKVWVDENGQSIPVGTATVVDYKNGLALTASHVFEGLKLFDGTKYTGEIKLINHEKNIQLDAIEDVHRSKPSDPDISILSVSKSNLIYDPPLIPIIFYPDEYSTPFYMMGYTIGEKKISFDSLDSYSSIENPSSYSYLAGNSDHGHSGSIVFDVSGNAIGLLKGGLTNNKYNLIFTKFVYDFSQTNQKNSQKYTNKSDQHALLNKFGDTINTNSILNNLKKRNIAAIEKDSIQNMDLSQAELIWLYSHIYNNPREYIGLLSFVNVYTDLLFCKNLTELKGKLIEKFFSFSTNEENIKDVRASTIRLLAQMSYKHVLDIEKSRGFEKENAIAFLEKADSLFTIYKSKNIPNMLIDKTPLGPNFHHEHSVALLKKFKYTSDINDYQKAIDQSLLGLKSDFNQPKLYVVAGDALLHADKKFAAGRAYGMAYAISKDEQYKESWEYALNLSVNDHEENSFLIESIKREGAPKLFNEADFRNWIIESDIDKNNVLENKNH